MYGISPFTAMLIVWGVVTGVFIILMILRSLVSMKEDDQLFLDPAESKMEEEQKEVLTKLNRLTPYTKGFGFASAGLAVLIVGFWLYDAFARFG